MAIGDRKVVNPFKPLMRSLPSSVSNRYLIIASVFILWMLFFDKASVWKQFRLMRSYSRLQSDKVYYQNKIKEVEFMRDDINNNIEKFARERYFVKANDEDIYIIESVKK